MKRLHSAANFFYFLETLTKNWIGLPLLTGVVGEGVEDGDEVVQAGPVVRVALQTLLEGVAGQRDAEESHSQKPDFKPHVDIGGVQHDGLKDTHENRAILLAPAFTKSIFELIRT